MIQRTAQRTIATSQDFMTEDLSWQEELKQIIRSPEALFAYLNLDKAMLPAAKAAHRHFPVRVTRSYLSRIEAGNIHDPLLLQVLPIGLETAMTAGYMSTPLQEHNFNPSTGLVHKYADRVLLIASSHCAINCRYCFRRAFDYDNNRMSKKEWLEALDYIRSDTSISEVILSGGDPLSLTDSVLAWLVDEIATIEHVERLRVHTRLPIVLPSRITQDLLAVFTQTRLQSIWVVHTNHANEIDAQVASALEKTYGAGIHLLNQSVLLKGVNDNAATLEQLSRKLFQHRTLPYYLHLLDKVHGAAHFDLPEQEAIAIHESLRNRISGYLLPKLVREVPGTQAKQQIG